MAAAPDVKLAKNITENYLECPICFKLYHDQRALPCQHIFCHKCLGDLINRAAKEKRQFTCPMCATEIDVPDNGADGFCRSTYITGIKDEVMAARPDTQSCDVCLRKGKDSKGTHRCLDCKEWLCRECKEEHVYHGSSANHLVVTLDDFQSDKYKTEIAKREVVYCRLHPEKPVELFCETCEEPICHLCVVLKQCHKDHPCESIPDAVKKIQSIVKSNIETLKGTRDTCKQRAASAERKKFHYERQQKDIKESIGLHTETLVQAILEKQSNLNVKVDQDFSKEHKKMESEIDELSSLESQIKSTACLAENILQCGSEAKTLRFHKQLCDQTKRLQGHPMITRPSDEPKSFRFTPRDSLVQNVAGGISAIGIFEEVLPAAAAAVKHSTAINKGHPPPFKLTVTRVKRFGTESQPDSKSPLITGVAINKHSNIHVSDSNNNKIKVFDTNGQLQREWTGEGQLTLDSPCGIAISNDGDIAVTSGRYGNGEVIVLDSRLKVKHVINAPGCLSVTWSNQNHMVCSNNLHNSVVVVGQDGVKLSEIKHDKQGNQLFGNSWHVATTPNDEIVVSDSDKHCIYVLTLEGDIVFRYGRFGWGEGEKMLCPTGVCVDRYGNIMVSDCGNHRIHLVSPDGKFVRHLVTKEDGLKNPRCITVDNDGNLFVVDDDNHVNVFRYL